MATTANFNETNALFLGLFDKVAAPSGQAYWADQLSLNSTAALNSISTFVNGGAAFTAGATGAGTIGAEITSIFENLLGRAPLSGGLTYWSDQYTSGAQSIGQIAADIYNITNAIPAGTGYSIDSETMNARVYAAGSFTQDYAAGVISPTTFSTAAAYNYITTTSDLSQSGVIAHPTAYENNYSPSGIQGTMTSTTPVQQFIPITAVQTSYAATLTSSASPVVYVVNDTGASLTPSVIVNGVTYTDAVSATGYNGYVTGNLATTPPTGPSPFASASYAANGGVLSSSDSLNASGGNGILDIFAYATTLGSPNFAPSYTGLLPSTMTGINTIIINGNAMDLNTSTGAAASVHNITISAAVNDALCEYITGASTPALSTFQYGGANHAQEINVYTIASTQNFTYENTNQSANINSTGTSANVTVGGALGALSQNGSSVSPTINIDGSTTAILNLTSAGTTANYLSLSTTTVSNLFAPALTAAPLTTLNISGVSGNTLNISLMADNTNNALAATPANTTIASLTTINASHDAGTLNLTTNTASDIITVDSSTTNINTITTSAIYDTLGNATSATASTTPLNMTTISGITAATTLSNINISFSGDTATTISFAAATSTAGYNPLNSFTTNITNIITYLQGHDAGVTAVDNAVYFQEGGNTYIVNDIYNGTTTYTDQVVQLTGTPNISGATPTSVNSHPVITL
ncbi:MAG: hypothetical protein EVG15_04500 [Candidatus Acididesulfobacter diazotrophicus]|uniref:DUF4214 domain-containing protein n=1 Tax=Candidatus Acididesulfobacter diazotrophicus TaxID=2597226 RepID=A0A519BMZ6_9DELT|nr:MAG: hypothetical protein EVG15_04500 [Candidatus Acididesulfobacter diazotrophicus]